MLYEWIDILGLISFSISGTLAALHKKLDVFGVIIVAFVTSIGGGTIRDLLIGVQPVSWLLSLQTPAIIFGAAVLAIIFRRRLGKFATSLFLFDTLGIGLYTIIGIEKAMAAGIHPILCVGLGTVTACFGGVSRDILINDIPIIFQKEIYATACIAGGAIYTILAQFPAIDNDFSAISGIIVVIAIRMYAVIFRKSLPSLYQE